MRVLYIAGWGRSGSTLVDRMLGQLPGVVSTGELRELWFRGCIEDRRCGCGVAFSACPFWREVGARAYGGWERADPGWMHREGRALDRLALLPRRVTPTGSQAPRVRRYTARLRPLYEAIATVSGADTVVDSSKLANYAALLAAMPGLDLRVVHLVRDARGVIDSWSRHVPRHDGGPDAGDQALERYGLVGAAARYVGYNALVPVVARRTLRVRYEDVVRAPQREIARIAAHAGWLPGPDAFGWLHGRLAELRVNHTVDGNPRLRLDTGPLEIRADERWRASMGPGRRAAATALTLPLLVPYGYLRDRAA